MTSQGTNIDDHVEGNSGGEVIADIEVEREYGIGYAGDVGKDDGQGREAEEGGYEE